MRRLGPALLLSLALLPGCGGDEDDSERPAVTVSAGEELTVAGDEYSFDPSRAVVIGAGKLTITLRNEGALAHNLKLVRAERELGGTPTFAGGETRSGTVRLRPGRYEMVCTVGNHAELGMVGSLQVK